MSSAACLEAPPAACHGRCFGFEAERATWAAPQLAVRSDAAARPGYDSMDASEYRDVEEVLRAKVRVLARLIAQSRRAIVYSGAGLSTGAGISDYASQAPDSVGAGVPGAGSATFKSPLCAQPTLAHRILVALHRAGRVHQWVNQNHDGLPQKAGLPQESINEIHGAFHAPDNPVVDMSGHARADLSEDLQACEREADLVIAVGTSLCGMKADGLVTSAAERAAEHAGQEDAEQHAGSIIIGLQRTVLDEGATLRLFGRCDEVFGALAEEMGLEVPGAWPEGEYFVPPCLQGLAEEQYRFEVPYDAAGQRCADGATQMLDLTDDAERAIPRGPHAGATGVVDGFDREGNVRCRLMLKAPKGKLRAPVQMLLGRWWIQAAVDGTVPLVPVVNKPAEGDGGSEAQQMMIALIKSYSAR